MLVVNNLSGFRLPCFEMIYEPEQVVPGDKTDAI